MKITDFSDPAGLQRSLRAAGVRADVTTVPSGCLPGEILDRKLTLVRVIPSTFPAPYIWWRLLLRPGGTTVLRAGEFLPGQTDMVEGTTASAGDEHLNITIAPNELPPGRHDRRRLPDQPWRRLDEPAGGSDRCRSVLRPGEAALNQSLNVFCANSRPCESRASTASAARSTR